MSAPFFITALPRSGTGFLANFLTHQDVFCCHEALCGVPDMKTMVARMASEDGRRMGDSDCALPAYHRAIRRAFPGALWIGIEREPLEVMDSLMSDRVGLWPGSAGFREMLEAHQKALLGCEIRIKFNDLFLTETLRYLWQNISQMPFDGRRAEMLKELRVEPNMRRYRERYQAARATQMPAEAA